jgi:hypothetical protein
MIPPVVMYFLGGVLALWGVYRVYLGRRATKARSSHLVFGILYVLMGAFLILTTAGIVPAPRFGGRPTVSSRPPRTVPIYPIPRPPASQPASQAASGPAASRPAPPAARPQPLPPPRPAK